MKCILLLTLFAISCIALDIEEDTWIALKNKHQMQLECSKELDIEDTTVENIRYKDFKCLTSCMMRKKGFLNKGLIDIEAVTELINNKSHLKEELKAKIIGDLPGCAEYVRYRDECDKALGFSSCLVLSMSFHAGELKAERLLAHSR
ncbi:Obp19d.2 family protein [Megaselia abdita]